MRKLAPASFVSWCRTDLFLLNMNPDSPRQVLPSIWRSIRVAIGLVTVLPSGDWHSATPDEKRHALYFLPLIGLGIGLLLWLVWYVLPSASWLTAMVLLIVWVVLTGALHLDGLADCVDALVGGHRHRDPKTTLSILQDPAIGPMAVIALILVLGTKLVSLHVMVAENAVAYLLMVPTIGRIAIVVLYGSMPYIRAGGLGESLSPVAQDRHWMWLCLGGSFVVMVPFLGVILIPGLIAAAGMFWLVWVTTMKRIQGFTGDVAGALIELVEAVVLLAIALMLSL